MEKITQAELDILIKQHEEWLSPPSTGSRLSLDTKDLSGLSFEEANLRKAVMTNCNLKRADFTDTYLRDAVLDRSVASGAIFHCTTLVRASLQLFRATDTLFERCDLTCANLTDSVIRYSRFVNSECAETKFNDVQMSGVEFVDTPLNNASVVAVGGYPFLSVSGVGSFRGNIIYDLPNDKVFAGCWSGNLDEFYAQGMIMNTKSLVNFNALKNVHHLFLDFKEDYTGDRQVSYESSAELFTKIESQRRSESSRIRRALAGITLAQGSMRREIAVSFPPDSVCVMYRNMLDGYLALTPYSGGPITRKNIHAVDHVVIVYPEELEEEVRVRAERLLSLEVHRLNLSRRLKGLEEEKSQ